MERLMVDRATEERWCVALNEKGIDAVRVELDMRPGPATEVCYNIGDEPPYPTRAFCEEWCRGKPPRRMGLSGPTSMVVAMSLLVVVCIIRAIGSFSPSEKNWLSDNSVAYVREAVPTMRASSGSSMNQIANSDVITTSEQHTIRPACSAVSSAGDARTVQKLADCSKLGSQPGQQKSK
jgi:hypothetical protein